MKKSTQPLLLLCMLLPLFGFAQYTQKLENAVTLYNGLKESSTKTSGIAEFTKTADLCETLLKDVISGGSADEQATAKYFRAVLAQHRAEAYYRDNNKDLKKVLLVLNNAVSEFDRLNESAFPFRYQFGGKNFIIQYTDFIYTRRQFYAQLAEVYNRSSDDAKFEIYAQKAIDLVIPGDYFAPYLMYYFWFFNHQTSEDKVKDLQKMIEYYGDMKPESKAELNKNSSGMQFIKTNAAAYMLNGPKAAKGWDQAGSASVSVATNLQKSGDLDSLAAVFYNQSIDRGAVLAGAQAWSTLPLLVKYGYTSNGLKLANNIHKNIASTQCDELDRLAPFYTKLGDPQKGNAVAQSATKCRADADKRAAEAEQRAADAEKRRQKQLRRSNRQRVYLGAYVLRIVQRPQYIDLGGTLDIPAGSSRLEFSYMLARNDQDYLLMERLKDSGPYSDFTNPHWDGHYAHFGYKKMERPGRRTSAYKGFLLSYNQRNFQPAFTNVVEESTGNTVAYDASFEPKQTSYGIMFTAGSMWLGKGFGRDLYYGMGATYNQFDLNNSTWPNTQYNFTNPLLQGRKAAYWGIQLRIGMTFGLSL